MEAGVPEEQAIPPWLLAPPAPPTAAPPSRTAPALLPLDAIDWADFERLCLALARDEGEPQRCSLYGTRGQRQQGIDIFSRIRADEYAVYQCKQYEELKAADLRSAATKFLEGSWVDRAKRFVVCTSDSGTRTQLAEEIEAQHQRLAKDGIDFDVWDAEHISASCKSKPTIVWDFFGDAWTEAFCPPDLARPQRGRLDVHQVHELRDRLRTFYTRLFARYDAMAPAVAQKTIEPLTERFVRPDVLRRRELPSARPERQSAPTVAADREPPPRLAPQGPDALVHERLSVGAWLGQTRRAVLIGDPGSGKSSLLRWLCLDLLASEPSADGLGPMWKAFLPVWVPFGRWASRIADGQSDLALGGLVEGYFASFNEPALGRLAAEALEDDRVLLFVDGLDESNNPDAAGAAAERLQQYVTMREVPVLAGTRREGLRAFGSLDPEWSIAELAPLTVGQQASLIVALGASDAAAEEFLARVRRVAALRALTGVPLLLGLLWLLHAQGADLPRDRFAAYRQFVAHMIGPNAQQRRRAAVVPSALRLTERQVEHVLSEVALISQERAGAPVVYEDAIAAARTALGQSGVSPSAVGAQALAVIDEGLSAIGLLRDAGDSELMFSHRSLQEYLAGRAVSRRPNDEQLAYVRGHAGAPEWTEPLLNLVYERRDDGGGAVLVEHVLHADESVASRWGMAPFLAHLASGPFLLPPELTTELVDRALEDLRADGWLPAQEAVLDALLEDVGGVAHGRLDQAMDEWFPGYAESRAAIAGHMGHWPRERRNDEALIRALADEHLGTARAAGRALVSLCAGEVDMGNRLASILKRPLSGRTRSVVLETLDTGWPTHPVVTGAMERLRTSIDPDLRLVALQHRIRRRTHTDDDLPLALDLAQGPGPVSYDRRPDLSLALAEGWPRDERIKRLSLEAVGLQVLPRTMNADIARWLLLAHYPDDDDVRAWIKQELKRDRTSLSWWNNWHLLVESYRDDPILVPAVDEWLEGADPVSISEVCTAAMLGRTPIAKRVLLNVLAEPMGSLSWPFEHLLKGWPDDEAVLAALEAAAFGPAEKAGEAAYLFRDVVVDTSRRHERLLDLLADPSNPRPELAIRAVAEEEDPQLTGRAIPAAVSRVGERSFGRLALRDALVAHFSTHETVAPLVDDAVHREPGLSELAFSARKDPMLRPIVRSWLNPLPGVLRSRLAQRLFEGAGTGSAVRLMWHWEDEVLSAAAGPAASAIAIRSDPSQRAALVDAATRALHAGKGLHGARPGAGLAALLELGEIQRFATACYRFDPQRPVTIDLSHLGAPDWWLASRIVANYAELKRTLGESLFDRVSEYNDAHATWDVLSPFAAQHPGVREELLGFVRARGTAGHSGLLRFLAAVRPRSRELLDVLLTEANREIGDRGRSRDGLLTALDLLAEHFGGDEQALTYVLEVTADWHHEQRVLILLMAWPQAARPDLDRRSQLHYSYDLLIRAQCCNSDHQAALDSFMNYIVDHADEPEWARPPVRQLVRRLHRDVAMRTAMERRMRATTDASELGAWARVLAMAGGLGGPVREFVARRCEMSLDGPDVDVMVVDVTALRLRPLGHVLFDALHGAG